MCLIYFVFTTAYYYFIDRAYFVNYSYRRNITVTVTIIIEIT